jgi:flagellin-like hook-associated protein FlgL
MTSFISTQSIASMLRQSVLQMQSELATGETELSTGSYADLGVTLGAGISESFSLQSETSLLQTITNTNQTVSTRLNSWSNSWSSASSQTLTSQISGSQTVNSSVSANSAVFQQLAQAYTMVADLGTQNLNAAAYQAVTSTAQGLLSSAIGSLVNLQASVGVIQSNVSTATNKMSAEMNILSAQIGNLDNVNPYNAATRVNSLQTQIQTAYSLTAQLQHLSLVKYL